jgi:hypothetical protein
MLHTLAASLLILSGMMVENYAGKRSFMTIS